MYEAAQTRHNTQRHKVTNQLVEIIQWLLIPYSTYDTPMGEALYSVTEEGGGRTIHSFMQSNVV